MPLRYLEASQIRAWRPAGAVHLRVEIAEDRTILSARIKRAFPTSEPESYLSIQDGDGKEVGVLKSTSGLDPETRELLREEMDRRYFTPSISKIDELKPEAGMWKWNVQTQRGPTEFYVRNWRDNGFEISPGRWQIHSVDGGRFEIVQLENLDAQSQRLLDQLL